MLDQRRRSGTIGSLDPVAKHRALGNIISDAVRLRQQSGLYAGLLERFEAIEKQLQADFASAACVSHPGDKGDAREEVLRRFLSESGYLPGRYEVAKGSSHAVSTSGHISKQLDLLLYDALNSPKLLAFGNIQYFPIESCYGCVEVKSRLDKREIEDGFAKIASFKRLRPRIGDHLVEPYGFGILFAYTSSVSWSAVSEAAVSCAKEYPSSEWPNLIVVLDHGILGFMGERAPLVSSAELRTATRILPAALAIGHSVLLTFYLLLVDLLGAIELPMPALRHYAVLPLTCGEHTYRFEYGPMFEAGRCPDHGAFPRTLAEAGIQRILAACPQDSEKDLGQLLDPAQALRQSRSGWGRVRVYNPDALPLEKLLRRPAVVLLHGANRRVESLDYELLEIDGERYLLPHYYIARDDLISSCPRCPSAELSGISLDDWRNAHERRAQDAMTESPVSED